MSDSDTSSFTLQISEGMALFYFVMCFCVMGISFIAYFAYYIIMPAPKTGG